MKRSIVIVLGMLALAGCDKAESSPRERFGSVPADDTRNNLREERSTALTPEDQGESELDRGITQRIRQGVVSDDTLSLTAKNVKIITVDGVVTLRGPVKSEMERKSISGLAARTEGVTRVDNELQIATD